MVTTGQLACSADDSSWYKDAVIYTLHVKTFVDGNGDGIGDFAGLIEKLDYLVSLGVTCLWLLPFYASPLRDDGYDIADYERVDPRFGSLNDFVRFVAEAHRRGLRIITELVLNHTSSDHPWFQASRHAPAGSPTRDFYVWSDTDRRYQDARVIFHEVEPSNWTWDPIAGAYYWHRFFHHEPDLNFDNPRVRLAVIGVLQFWLDLGVDGLCLDAVACLYEREGTTCDSLPETHRFLKQIRAIIERHYPGRALIANAAQWPADARPYFGNGDECHMACCFALLPRFLMALKLEHAFPIVDIITEIQQLPATGQWAMFLRNHDELTLSAVTDEHRDFLFRDYAFDPHMRRNHGIRRRLAPLLDNSDRRLNLAQALLMSLPGSPVVYYGDEIGMGDNVRLGDRDGVRTPMQWSAAVNGGFSPERFDAPLVSPPIDGNVYGYRIVNVSVQESDPDSVLTWIRRLVHVRRLHRAFSRGSIEFMSCDNPGVIAFARRWEDETIVVIANLTASVQRTAIDFPSWAEGSPVVDMIDDAPFPPVPVGPYRLRVDSHACHWLGLHERIVRTARG
jgi:maltose alpha-D-glucosyltransferase/alpha-amylase